MSAYTLGWMFFHAGIKLKKEGASLLWADHVIPYLLIGFVKVAHVCLKTRETHKHSTTLPNNRVPKDLTNLVCYNVFSHWIPVMTFQGVVFFALFNHKESGEFLPKEAATVIKIASSRMATQSERLGCEFAKWLGVRSPQARVIHNCSPEWSKIKEAT
ncbi:dual specificity protein phosphatase PHS1 isoform X2 [Tanacetum coccineum]